MARVVRSSSGALLVSGYLYDPTQTLVGSADAGSTHAWGEVYLPGGGWITFDPTNHRTGSAHLIPVARDLQQAMPVVGSFTGPPGSDWDMTVEVRVTAT